MGEWKRGPILRYKAYKKVENKIRATRKHKVAVLSTDKPLARLSRKKENSGNERREIAVDTAELQWTIREFYELLSTNKLDT